VSPSRQVVAATADTDIPVTISAGQTLVVYCETQAVRLSLTATAADGFPIAGAGERVAIGPWANTTVYLQVAANATVHVLVL